MRMVVVADDEFSFLLSTPTISFVPRIEINPNWSSLTRKEGELILIDTEGSLTLQREVDG